MHAAMHVMDENQHALTSDAVTAQKMITQAAAHLAFLSLGRPRTVDMNVRRRREIDNLLDNLRTVQTAKQPEMTEPAARMVVAVYLHMVLWTRSELGGSTPTAAASGGAAQAARVSTGPSKLTQGRGGEAHTSHASASLTSAGNQNAASSHGTTGVSYARRAEVRSSAAAHTEDQGWPDVPHVDADRVGISYIRGGAKQPNASTASQESHSCASVGESSYTSSGVSRTQIAIAASTAQASSPLKSADEDATDDAAEIARYLASKLSRNPRTNALLGSLFQVLGGQAATISSASHESSARSATRDETGTQAPSAASISNLSHNAAPASSPSPAPDSLSSRLGGVATPVHPSCSATRAPAHNSGRAAGPAPFFTPTPAGAQGNRATRRASLPKWTAEQIAAYQQSPEGLEAARQATRRAEQIHEGHHEGDGPRKRARFMRRGGGSGGEDDAPTL